MSRFFDQSRDRHKYLQQGAEEQNSDDSENDEEMGRAKTPPDTGRSMIYSHERAHLQFKDSFPFSSEKNDELSRFDRRTREAKRLKEETERRAHQSAARRKRLASLKHCPDRGQLVVLGGVGNEEDVDGFDYEDEEEFREQRALQLIRASDEGAHSLLKNVPLVAKNATKVQVAVLERMARNFVRLFSQVQSVQNDPKEGVDNIHPIFLPRKTEKDIFFDKFSDGLAQSLFYSLCIAYPKSRKEISNSHFRTHLARLVSEWVHGVPLHSPDTSHWKILQKEPKANTLLQQALQFVTEAPKHKLDKKLEFLDDKLGIKERRENEGRRPSSGASSNTGHGSASPSLPPGKSSPSTRSMAQRSLSQIRSANASAKPQSHLASLRDGTLNAKALIQQAHSKLDPPKKVVQESRIGNAPGGLNSMCIFYFFNVIQNCYAYNSVLFR